MKNLPSWNLKNGLDKRFFPNFQTLDAPQVTQKPKREDFRELKSKTLPGGACPRIP